METASLQEIAAPEGICYGCGCGNPHGLHIKSYWHDDGIHVMTQHTPEAKYSGWPELVYGGEGQVRYAKPDPATPLWRAAQVFRLLSCLYALGFQIAINAGLDRPAIGWLLFAVLIGWSMACAVAYLQGFGRRPAWVLAEVVVVVALVLSTEFVASEQWALDN